MDNEKEIVLYYPYIDIDDASLMKTAALYWDEIQTIVPYDEYEYYDKHGSLPSNGLDPYANPISKEAKAAGFLKPRFVNPEDESVKKAGREIITDIRKTPEIKTKIKEMIKKPVRTSQRIRPKFSKLSMSKIDINHLINIVFEFKEAGIHISPADNNYMIVPTAFSDTYMSMLASSIATNDGTIPLTNVNLWNDALIDRYINYDEERMDNQGQLATMSLKTISIDPNVPLIEILRFRNDHRDMLINFRRQIRELSRQVAQGLNTAEKQSVFEEIIGDNIRTAKVEIESKLKESNLGFVRGCIVITLAGCVGVVISQEWLAPFITAGILAGAELIDNIRSDRFIQTSDPLGYLYEAQKRLGIRERD